MAFPEVDLKIVIDKVNEKIHFTDQSDWAGQGVTEANVRMAFYIVSPAGDFYMNDNYSDPALTPDIDRSVSALYDHDGIPLDSEGNIMTGLYTFNVVVKITGGVGAGTYKVTPFAGTIDADFAEPVVDIQQSFNCVCATFRSQDLTDYGDSTEIAYDHEINYPQEADLEDINTALKDYTDSILANGTYVTVITTLREWTFGDFTLQIEITGSKRLTVDCSSLCGIKCGINNLYEAIESACEEGDLVTQKLLQKKLDQALQLLQLANLNMNCGEATVTQSYLTKIKEIIGDCDCEHDEEIMVTPLCGAAGGSTSDITYVFQKGGLLKLTVSGPAGGVTTVTYELTSTMIRAALMVGIDTKTFDSDLDFIATINGIIAALVEIWAPWTGAANVTDLGLGGTPTIAQIIEKLYDTVEAVDAMTANTPVTHPDTVTTLVSTPVVIFPGTNDYIDGDYTVYLRATPGGANVAPGTPVATLNGSATVRASDGKTIDYTPTTGFVGNDTIYYVLIDSHAVESNETAITITVTATTPASCAIVTPGVLVTMYEEGGKLRLFLQNTSDYLTNTPNATNYTLTVRDNTTGTVHAEGPVAGNLNSVPTAWLSAVDIAEDWYDVVVRITVDSEDDDGNACVQQFVDVTVRLDQLRIFENKKPTAVSPRYITALNTTLTIASATDVAHKGLFNFVSDPDPADTIVLKNMADVQAPFVGLIGTGGGTLDVAADGGFVFTPAAGYVGEDWFQLKAVDNALSSQERTFWVGFEVGQNALAQWTQQSGEWRSAGSLLQLSEAAGFDNRTSYTLQGYTLHVNGELVNVQIDATVDAANPIQLVLPSGKDCNSYGSLNAHIEWVSGSQAAGTVEWVRVQWVNGVPIIYIYPGGATALVVNDVIILRYSLTCEAF